MRPPVLEASYGGKLGQGPDVRSCRVAPGLFAPGQDSVAAIVRLRGANKEKPVKKAYQKPKLQRRGKLGAITASSQSGIAVEN
jgi:hypothetical protein